MNALKEIPITIVKTGSKEDCNIALTEARQYVIKKILNKIQHLKSEQAC